MTFAQWTKDYLLLRQTQKDLRAFMAKQYEGHLERVAAEYFDSVLVMGSDRVELPCERCKIQVTGLIEEDAGWYFEWTCDSDGYGCSASTFGWSVPLPFIEAYLANEGIT
jgi:hypothetical protein